MIFERSSEEMGRRERQARRGPPDQGDAGWEPSLITSLVVFLASDAAADVTCRDFLVQGSEISLMSVPVEESTVIREGGGDPQSLERVLTSAFVPVIEPPVAY